MKRVKDRDSAVFKRLSSMQHGEKNSYIFLPIQLGRRFAHSVANAVGKLKGRRNHAKSNYSGSIEQTD